LPAGNIVRELASGTETAEVDPLGAGVAKDTAGAVVDAMGGGVAVDDVAVTSDLLHAASSSPSAAPAVALGVIDRR
jgi:hypothetical protein